MSGGAVGGVVSVGELGEGGGRASLAMVAGCRGGEQRRTVPPCPNRCRPSIRLATTRPVEPGSLPRSSPWASPTSCSRAIRPSPTRRRSVLPTVSRPRTRRTRSSSSARAIRRATPRASCSRRTAWTSIEPCATGSARGRPRSRPPSRPARSRAWRSAASRSSGCRPSCRSGSTLGSWTGSGSSSVVVRGPGRSSSPPPSCARLPGVEIVPGLATDPVAPPAD